MGVFIIDPRLTVKDTFYADEFNKEVVKQLREYCVELYEVNDKNMAGCKMKIAEDALVIVYNEYDIEHSLIVGVQEFLKKSIEKKAQIWPVAIDRSARIPVGVISKNKAMMYGNNFGVEIWMNNILALLQKYFQEKL